jgi:hypothetical protein
MHKVTLTLPDDLYAELQAEAARVGISLAEVIVERLTAESPTAEQRAEEKRLLQEVLDASGLLQPVSPDLVAAYVLEPSAPRRSPVRMQGAPLSAMIIEQRGTLG